MNIRLSELKDLESMVEIYNQAIITHKSTADINGEKCSHLYYGLKI